MPREDYWASNEGGVYKRPIGFPRDPEAFNIKKIGNAYYTNVYYEENYYDLRPSIGRLGINNVTVPSINIMVSSRNRFSNVVSKSGVQFELALAFNYARIDLILI